MNPVTTTDIAPDTKTALLNCAERLFLARDFDKVSIREITDAANANIAAINYHFGGKTKLYRAVLAKRFAEVARKRVELIESLHRKGHTPSLREIVASYVRNHFTEALAAPDGEQLLQIVYREMSPGAIAADLVATELVAPIHTALSISIKTVSPQLSDSHISRCISSITGQVLHFIRFREVLQAITKIGDHGDFIEETTEHITAFSLKGIGSEHHEQNV